MDNFLMKSMLPRSAALVLFVFAGCAMEGPAAVSHSAGKSAPSSHASAARMDTRAGSAPSARPAAGAPISAARVRELAQVVETLRGRKFKTEVRVNFLRKAELTPRLVKLFDDEMPAEKMAREAAVLKAFALIPAEARLRDLYLTLLTAQVVGLYDPASKALYVVTDADAAGAGKPDAAQLQELLQGINPVDIAIVHELDHALSDQYFDLEKLLSGAADQPDRAAALQALVEGEATLAMIQYSLDVMLDAQGGGPDQSELLQTLAAQLTPETLGVLNAGDPTLKNLPPYLVEKLESSYTDGLRYVLAAHAHGGWPAVDALYAHPPGSTHEILHPGGKFPWRSPVETMTAPPGWSLLAFNQLGEQDIGMILSAPGAAAGGRTLAAALTLSGDAVFTAPLQGKPADDPGVARAFAWYSEWATLADRASFEAAVRRRYPGATISKMRDRGILVSQGFSAATALGLKPPAK
jgi:hypothetical protein